MLHEKFDPKLVDDTENDFDLLKEAIQLFLKYYFADLALKIV